MTSYFARLDRVIPGDNDVPLRVLLDAIRTDWSGFESGPFALSANMESADAPARSYWQSLFSNGLVETDAFEDAPIVQIEVSDPRDRSLPRQLLNPRRPWLQVETEVDDGIGAIIYSPGEKGLFDEQVEDSIANEVVLTESAAALSRIFDMQSWARADAGEVYEILSGVSALSQMISIDVGQGSALALADTAGKPRLYFDVGAGMGRHSSTTPTDLTFCVCNPKAIVLSHWDTDHWIGARADPRLLKQIWIAPLQRVGPSHAKLANDILIAGGDIKIYASKQSVSVPLYWNKPKWGLRSKTPDQQLSLVPCSGKSRNDSGFALRILDFNRSLQWLLCGDASYDVIPQPPAEESVEYAVVTASHHGALQRRKGSVIPPAPARNGRYARLLYSFGLPNHFGHPHASTVTANAIQGWRHGAMIAPYNPKRQDVLATGLGDLLQSRASVAGGWRRRPLVAHHLIACVPGYRFVR